MFLQLGLVDFVHEVQKGQGQSYHQLRDRLREIDFHVIYTAHQSFRSAWFTLGLKGGQKIGFWKWWNQVFFSSRVRENMRLPEALRQMQLTATQDQALQRQIAEYANQYPLPQMGPVPVWASMQVLTGHSRSKTAALFPGSVWATKRWTLDGFIQVTKKLRDQGWHIILLGTADERILGEGICQKLGSNGIENKMGDLDLRQTLKILESTSLVISNDSGGQHLASVAGVPVVSIFGPTVLDLGFRPWAQESKVVEVQGLACRPCGKHGHQVCPIGTHDCMKKIDASQVWQAVESILRQDLSH